MCGAKLVLVKLMNAESIRTEGAGLLCWSTPLGPPRRGSAAGNPVSISCAEQNWF
jgi:hypothetical protein